MHPKSDVDPGRGLIWADLARPREQEDDACIAAARGTLASRPPGQPTPNFARGHVGEQGGLERVGEKGFEHPRAGPRDEENDARGRAEDAHGGLGISPHRKPGRALSFLLPALRNATVVSGDNERISNPARPMPSKARQSRSAFSCRHPATPTSSLALGKAALKRAAEADDRSVSSMALRIIRDWLTNEKFLPDAATARADHRNSNSR